MPEQVLAWATRNADAVAVSQGVVKLTYGQLTARAEEIAAGLTAQGITRGDHVAVALPRSPDLIAVLLGVWLSGAAYVPIDRRYPVPRRRVILEDSGATLLISDEPGDDELGVPRVSVEALGKSAPGGRTAGPAEPEDLAYVIFTSGSTGRPKGVMVEHRNLTDFVTADARLDILPGQSVAQLAPVSFDASVFEIWTALAHGAHVVLLQGDDISADVLGKFLREVEPEWLFLTSGLFHLLVE
ncbi:AMP-binding protein, partial [Streptomyces decoyicus]